MGARYRVTDKGKSPPNWQNFLRDNNKTELFNFLADKIVYMCTPNAVIVTKEEDAVSNHTISLDGVTLYNHEDTKIFMHAKHAVAEGNKALMIKANDTDVLVIAVSVLPALKEFGLEKLWLAFGQGRNLRWITIHNLITSVGPEKTRGILFFHSFTGCDVVSEFHG